MEKAKIIKFSEVKFGDVVCKQLDDLKIGLLYTVLDVKPSKDTKGPIVSLQFGRLDSPGATQHYNSDPDDLLILVRRPWPEGEQSAGSEILTRLSIGELIESLAARCNRIMKPPTPSELAKIGQAIDEYELGKPLIELAKK